MLSVEFVRTDELLNKKKTHFFLVTDMFHFAEATGQSAVVQMESITWGSPHPLLQLQKH